MGFWDCNNERYIKGVEMIKPPCKGCPLRQVKCHSSCERWAIYEKERNEEKAKVYAARYKEWETRDAEIKRKLAEQRRKGKK